MKQGMSATVVLEPSMLEQMPRSLSLSSESEAASPSSSVGGHSAGVSPQPICDPVKLQVLREVTANSDEASPCALDPTLEDSPNPHEVPQPLEAKEADGRQASLLSPTAHQADVDQADTSGFNSSLDDEVVGVTADGELLFRNRDGRRQERPAVRPTPRHQQPAVRRSPPRRRPVADVKPALSAEEMHLRYLTLRRRDKENDLYSAYVHEELQLLVVASESAWVNGLHERFDEMAPACLR